MNDESALVFAIADGAGSARCSHIGAGLAVDKFISEIAVLPPGSETAQKEAVRNVFLKIHAALMAEAEAQATPVREFSTTLLGGCICRTNSWFSQVGDGAAVIVRDGKYEAVTWPTSGEFVNTTAFMTEPDWERDFQFSIVEPPIDAVGAFTDGLQDLILVHADRSVHASFFEPMWPKMRATTRIEDLSAALRRFLDAAAVNARTDDDKTLMLACWKDE